MNDITNKEASQVEFLNMTAAEFRRMVCEGRNPVTASEKKKNNKYNAQKTEMDGFTYDSKKEANRGNYLMRLQEAGQIRDLERQKPFVLLEPFKYDGKSINGVKWFADFYYFDVNRNRWVAEDVKSPITRKKAEYIIKKKLFMKNYPKILFFEFV